MGTLAFRIAFIILFALTLSTSASAETSPQTGMDWYALGRKLQEEKQYARAHDAFQHALEMKFQPAGALLRMAQIAAKLGNTQDALDRLQAAYDISPFGFSLLPQIGGVPELESNDQFKALVAKSEAVRHPCKTRPEDRQFDFWVGSWTVSNAQGQVIGQSTITHDLEGCVVREAWTDGYGNRGTSVNFYDPATKHWHQVWTSENGTITHYQGDLVDGEMRFSAIGFGDADGKTHFRHMTFTPRKDGSVRQFFEDSDDGKTWTPSFEGIYRRTSEQ